MTQRAAKTREASGQPESAGTVLVFDGLDCLLGFRLRMAQNAMNRDFLAALSSLRISQPQTGALWLIGANPGVSQAGLADALQMDRATMVGVIDRLEAEGRVIRVRAAGDRRRHELHLTPRGVKALAAARRAIARHEKAMIAGVPPDELEAMMAALGRIAGIAAPSDAPAEKKTRA